MISHLEYDLEAQRSFFEIASNANAIVAYRISPHGKTVLVNIIKEATLESSTLAIGNGPITVAML